MVDDELIGLVAVVLLFGGPLLITFSITTTVLLNNLLRQREKEHARRVYREALKEKLDILKSAMLMGYSHNEVEALDRRLEKLVGEAKLRTLLHADSAQLRDAAARESVIDLEHELAHVRKIRDVQHG